MATMEYCCVLLVLSLVVLATTHAGARAGAHAGARAGAHAGARAGARAGRTVYNDDEPLCTQAGQKADELLALFLERWDDAFPVDELLYWDVLGLPGYFSFSQIICPMEGARNIEDALRSLYYSEDYTFKAFKGVYDYLTARLMRHKAALMNDLGPMPTDPVLDAIKAVERTGLTKLDLHGTAWMMENILPDGLWPSEEYTSTAPLDQQCRQLTNGVRQLWNFYVKNGPYGNQTGTYYREKVYNTTGVFLPEGPEAHRLMKNRICDLLESSGYQCLRDVYNHLAWETPVVTMAASRLYEAGAAYFARFYRQDYVPTPTHTDDESYMARHDRLHTELAGLLKQLGLLDQVATLDQLYPYPGEPFTQS